MLIRKILFLILTLLICAPACRAADNDLVIVDQGKTSAVIVAAPDAGKEETLAASDLARYIGLMSGAVPRIITAPDAITEADKNKNPVKIQKT